MKTYGEFRHEYEEQHPSSVPALEKAINPYPEWLRWMVLFMFIAAAILSGVHTIPTAYETIPAGGIIADEVRRIAAHAVLVIIEFALFVSVYAAASGKSNAARIIQLIALAGAIAANLHSVSKALNAEGDLGTIIVGIVLGIVAPLTALLSGEMYIKMHSAERRTHADARTRYAADQQTFDAAVLAAYETYRAEQERIAEVQHQREEEERRKEEERKRRAVRRLPVDQTSMSARVRADNQTDADTDSTADTADGRGHNTGQGYSKNMDARSQMRDYFLANPHQRSRSTRWLAENVGIGGKTVWAEIKAAMGTPDADNLSMPPAPIPTTNGHRINEGESSL